MESGSTEDDYKEQETFVLAAVAEKNADKLKNALNQLIAENEAVAFLNKLQNGNCLIHRCVGIIDCVQVLLEYGAKPDVENERGERPIHLAAKNDFVENLMILVIYGADINVAMREEPKATPIKLAVDTSSQSAEEFLLFCGALLGDNLLDSETREKHTIILNGIRDKKIAVGGEIFKSTAGRFANIEPLGVKTGRKSLSLDSDVTQSEVGVAINADKSFIIMVRRMQVDFQSSSIRIAPLEIPEDLTLISDIYQYKVNKRVKCDIRVRVHSKPVDKYTEALVVQTTEEDATFKEVHVTNGYAEIKDMLLQAHGLSPIVSFAVFTRNKIDSSDIDPEKDNVIKSTVEPKFQVHVPAGFGPANQKFCLNLQVMKAESRQNAVPVTSSEDAIFSHSDFCILTASDSASTVGEPSRPGSAQASSDDLGSGISSGGGEWTVELPKPKINSNQICVPLANDGDPLDPDNWLEIPVTGKEHSTSLEVKGKRPSRFIVVAVTGKIGYLIRETVRDLYEAAIGNKVKCRLFTMTRSINNEACCEILVLLCLHSEFSIVKKNYSNQGYEPCELESEEPVTMNSKTTYMLKLYGKYCSVDDKSSVPIQYQKNKHKSQTFVIRPKEDPLVILLCFKRHVPKKHENLPRKAKLRVPVLLRKFKTRTISPGHVLSDEFIENKVAKLIGDRWYELGIYLGWSISHMTGLHDQSSEKKGSLILFKWRDENKAEADKGLYKLIAALKNAFLVKVVSCFVEEVQKFKNIDPGLYNWLRKYESETDAGIKFDYTKIVSGPVSPFSDEFLLKICKRVVLAETFFISHFDIVMADIDVGRKTKPEIARICELFGLARDKCGEHPPVKFSRILVKALSSEYSLVVDELKKNVIEWLNSTDNGYTTDVKSRLEKAYGL